jgi:hypothetical protein
LEGGEEYAGQVIRSFLGERKMPRRTIESKQRKLEALRHAGLDLTPDTAGVSAKVFMSLQALKAHNEERRMGHSVRERLRKKLASTPSVSSTERNEPMEPRQ